MMKVLVCWPPEIPSYFNAGHHLPTFTIAAYLRAHGCIVDAIDAGALNYSWKEFADILFRGAYDVVAIVNDFDVVGGVRRAADYARGLLPNAVLLTVGRLSYQNPVFFQAFSLDAVAHSGDYETAAETVIDWVSTGRPPGPVPGVSLRTTDGWTAPSAAGRWLPPDAWVLPDVNEIPYAHYDQLYGRDANKFCGIPERRELVVPVARGCPVNCDFCDVPRMQGLVERRLSVERTLDYIRSSTAKQPFEYVAFYAPTFTLNRRWVRDLCAALDAQGAALPWKCATTLHHLDEDLVATMARAGCIRISVGVETFEAGAAGALPRIKRSARDRFATVVEWCNRFGVELNCFIIVGLPGTDPEETRKTIAEITSAGARVRPTLYTPYERMHSHMTEREMSSFNRQLFVDEGEIRRKGYDPADFLQLLYADDGYTTPAPALVSKVRDGQLRGSLN
jgi:anaerobic magnesium-protoporphyrin IX monomethyl ester cyclase